MRYLTPEEETKLRAELEARWPGHIPELDLALHTGLRLSEMYGLDWQDVDLARCLILHSTREEWREPLRTPKLNRAQL